MKKFDPMKNIIYLDMDDVLADFSGEIVATIGDMTDKFGTPMQSPKSVEQHFSSRAHFFAHLRPLPHAKDLYNAAMALTKSVQILTALPEGWPDQEQIKRDKAAWARQHISPNIQVNFGPRSSDKWRHAQPGDVLVDDQRANIESWGRAGGIGIHHDPTNPNRTLELLSALVETYK